MSDISEASDNLSRALAPALPADVSQAIDSMLNALRSARSAASTAEMDGETKYMLFGALDGAAALLSAVPAAIMSTQGMTAQQGAQILREAIANLPVQPDQQA